ncbi:DUF6462 family protein [Clostridium boliviensis]|uniref:DUF6462 family protein n=1 Tax=Clostridium boliviensis TaxID=318465 RepID=A0ABU4GHX9_9CLOT|nr:DUF6462 family protein [Clostridium boliviensis]MDW2796573.1 DUF6462 family protein [Clostridium boliviensis]
MDRDIFDEYLEQFHEASTEVKWKYSNKLDDVDLMFFQHDFIAIKQGLDYYGFSERPFLRMAEEAGAYYIRWSELRETFDRFC